MTAIVGLLAAAGAFAETAPRTWRFTEDYHYLDTKGSVVRRQRVAGDYTRGLPEGAVRWNDVSVANATGDSAPFGAPQKRDFMEGFTYQYESGKASLQPDFFKGFPPMAVEERNLVWDTQMVEGFADLLESKLKPNEVYHLPDVAEIPLGNLGAFRHKDVQIVWTGKAQRNGQDCALIDYRALFNRLEIKSPGMSLIGRSDYWGQIWVSLKSRRIEYATLYEEVLGELTLAGQEKPQIISVFRIGAFEPVVK
jgi:hypothetical protein